jgi:uncharacterized protein (UPF0333 family)
MRNIKYYSKNKAGVSAVIGVVLMVSITVAIAATVYVYVSNMMDQELVYSSYTGEFMGLYEENGSCSFIFIADDGAQHVIRNMTGVSDSEITYLGFLIGHETTIRYSEINDRFTYEGAYLAGIP